ncbi:MAG: ThuA domain-containing protein [Planctomycetota bacterium]
MKRFWQQVCVFCLVPILPAGVPQLHAEVIYEGSTGPGKGKHIVLVSGDEEYRSEEVLPQLGKILAKRHGFKCTVLLPIDPESGEIDPETVDNIPGLEALEDADLMILFTRFRNLPDDQMKYINAYVRSGRPVLGIRTATHAFQVPSGRRYHHYTNDYEGDQERWKGGFGRLVLGEKWISHHGDHGEESTGGILVADQIDHPILRGIKDREIWGATDVYGVRLPLPGDSQPLVLGAVLSGMNPKDEPVDDDRNDPMMPIAWTKSYKIPGGKEGRAFMTTLGSSQDLTSEGTRRMLVNATYWCLGMVDKITPDSDVALVGEFIPTPFGFGDFVPGVTPDAHEMQ